MHLLPCNGGCGRTLKRANHVKKASCEWCKIKRRREYSLQYARAKRRGVLLPRRKISNEKGLSFLNILHSANILIKTKLKMMKTKRNPFDMSPVEKKKREETILELRLGGKSLEEIAAVMTPRVTRERVRQILKKIEDREGISLPHRPKPVLKKVETTCQYPGCGKKILLYPSYYRGEGRHGCCQKHMLRNRGTKYMNPDGTRMTLAEKYRWIYHNVPGRKEMQKKASAAYHKRKMADPKYREKLKKYARSYVARKRELRKLKEKNRWKY